MVYTEVIIFAYYTIKSFIFQLKPVALAILRNAFCGPLIDELAFSENQPPQNRHISILMIHIVTAILSQRDNHLLHPYVCMLVETESLKVGNVITSMNALNCYTSYRECSCQLCLILSWETQICILEENFWVCLLFLVNYKASFKKQHAQVDTYVMFSKIAKRYVF